MSRREDTNRSPPSQSSNAPPPKAPTKPTSTEGKKREQANKPAYNPVAGTLDGRSNIDPGQRLPGGFPTYPNDPNSRRPNHYDTTPAGTHSSPHDQPSTRDETSTPSRQPKQATSSQPGLARVDSSKSTGSDGQFSDVDLGDADYDFVPDKAKIHGRYENGKPFPYQYK